ncbi:MAG: inositol monophosphatase [Spirochaetia bacterium]|nr:inositol monophosphatase [Spirochaetia bacterium]
MLETETLGFPVDEVVKRVAFVKQLLPSLGRRLLSYQDEVNVRLSDSPDTDRLMMTRADRYIETDLIKAIREKFPSDSITSEEEGEEDLSGEFHWWLDPVDGTKNYIHGLPLFAISAGLTFRGDPVAGIVEVPALRDTYHAILTAGAYKNESPIQVSNVDSIERSMITNGLPFNRKEILGELLSDISAFISSGIGLRRTGSAVLDLCWVAEGRFDAMWDRSLRPWDSCAASVIITESGGKISGFNGEAYHVKLPDLVAANASIHATVIEILHRKRNIEISN